MCLWAGLEGTPRGGNQGQAGLYNVLAIAVHTWIWKQWAFNSVWVWFWFFAMSVLFNVVARETTEILWKIELIIQIFAVIWKERENKKCHCESASHFSRIWLFIWMKHGSPPRLKCETFWGTPFSSGKKTHDSWRASCWKLQIFCFGVLRVFPTYLWCRIGGACLCLPGEF